MSWKSCKDIKPKHGQFVLLYGYYKAGEWVCDVVDYGWYFANLDEYTIGRDVRQSWVPTYWIELEDLPHDSIRESGSGLIYNHKMPNERCVYYCPDHCPYSKQFKRSLSLF